MNAIFRLTPRPFASGRWRIFSLIILLSLLVAGVALVRPNPVVARVDPQMLTALTTAPVQSGDLIFRQSDTFISNYIRSLDESSSYSHAGIVTMIDGEVWVIHARLTDGEYHGTVVQEPLADFLAGVTMSAIYRVRATPKQTAVAMGVAADMLTRQVPFDTQFDLSTDESLYCTEMVWKAWLAAGVDLVDDQFDQLSFPFTGEAYILPTTLAQSVKLTEVVAIQTTQ